MNKKVLIIVLVVLIVLVAIFGGVEAYFSLKGRKSSSTPTPQTIDESWSFIYNNMTMAIGDEFTREKFGEELEYSEVASCAFEGLDKTYKYEHYEITTYPENDKENIFSIYFLDDTVSTKEGLHLSDSYDKMVELYGDNFENSDNLYTYTNGNTLLNCIVENGVVTSIEYTLDVENNA